MRTFAPIFSFIVLCLFSFFAYSYFDNKNALIVSDPKYAQDSAHQILELFLIVSVAASFFLSALVYVLLTVKKKARILAYQISKEAAFSQEQFKSFYELSPVPYLLIDSKGVITRPNKASLRFFSKTEEEFINQNIFTFLKDTEHPDNISQYKEKVSRHIPLEQKEVQVELKDGELRWALLSIENIADQSTHSQNGLVTLVDIHEQKELERIKTEFLSLASHQLRTPLANIKWYIDFLISRRSDQMSDEVQGYLHKMYRRNSDMVELVNTLLNLSRIEMGRVKIELEETDVAEVIKSVVEELDPEAKDKNIGMETECPNELKVQTDGRLVRIIFQNLLSNALRYTKQGGKVYVRLVETTSSVRLEVQDTGVGIPPDEQGRIFSKLYRATNAKEIEANGNGIGLYMCKELAEGLGGEIKFVSKLNEGTTFSVELPK